MECIICRATQPTKGFSKEHIIPEALGGSLVTRRVCVSCNSRLGDRADGPLVNSSIMQFARMAFEIAGKSGVPNAFAGPARLADEPGQLVQVRTDAKGMVVDVHFLPQREKWTDENGRTRFRLVVDASDRERLPLMVNKILEREGVQPIPPEKVLDHARVMQQQQPVIDKTITYDLKSPRLGMLKIAYELTHRWLGEDYLHDPMGIAISRALLSDDDNWAATFGIKGYIGLSQEQSPLRLWADERTSHIALLVRNGSTLGVMLTLFHAFDAILEVSSTAELYEPVEQRFLALDAATGIVREDTLEAEFARKAPSDF
jgi:hypothetical protein